MDNLLFKSVKALPEMYQPIFGHPEFSGIVSRGCKDRILHIAGIYELLRERLGRQLNVLDLGCAQGYLTFSLAKIGAIVHGIDYLEENIAVCQTLREEHLEYKVTFEHGRIENILPKISADQYDLVLGLSVFHHLVYEIGANSVQKMLSELAGKIFVGIFELALNTEPLYWASSQPKNIRSLLKGFAFVNKLAEHGTHLSKINRPLYFASNHYWFLGGSIGRFDKWQTESHIFAHGVHHGTRHYFFGDRVYIKMFDLDQPKRTEENLQEYNNTINFLSNPPPGFNAPRLLQHGRNEHTSWLIRELLPGELLVDRICSGKVYDIKRILKDILAQLVALESVGLYHNDLRVWNILISPSGKASLIDYGSITNEKKDCVWSSGGIFLAFFIFVYEITNREIKFSCLRHIKATTQYKLKQPYQNWLYVFWSTPIDKWSFKLLLDLFIQLEELEKNTQITEKSSRREWMESIEKAVNTTLSFNSYLIEQKLKMAYTDKTPAVVWPFQKTILAFRLLIFKLKHVFNSLVIWFVRIVFANSYLRRQASKLLKHSALKQYLRSKAIRAGVTGNHNVNKTTQAKE